MDVILHLGAHGTATRRFQSYAAGYAQTHAAAGFGFAGPEASSGALCADVIRSQAPSVRTLMVSDADILGTLPDNLAAGSLYPQARALLRGCVDALAANVRRVVLSPRSLELYWCAAVANGVAQGAAVPDRSVLRAIALSRRGWRDVIADIATALPGVDIRVLPFEDFAGAPHRFLASAADLSAARNGACVPEEAAPLLPQLRRMLHARGQNAAALPFGMGRWNPFTNEEHAALRELYADDMMWLVAGADGLATLMQNCPETRAGTTPPSAARKKGQNDEFEEREMARPR